MGDKFKLIMDSFGSDKVKLDEPIGEHTFLRVGGPAKLFFVATHQREIIRMNEIARGLKIPVIVFGTGSKMIISDDGFNGVIIKNRTSGMTVVGVKGKVSKIGIGVSEVMVKVDSGVTITKLSEFVRSQHLNVNSLDGVTGTVGGNLFLSKQILDLTQKIKIIDKVGDIDEIEKEELRLREQIILSAVLKFKT